MYQTGPDISRKAPRTQRRYAKAVATQGTLDSFLSCSKAPPLPIYVPSRSPSPIPLDIYPPGPDESNTPPPLVPILRPSPIPPTVHATSERSGRTRRNIPTTPIVEDAEDSGNSDDEMDDLIHGTQSAQSITDTPDWSALRDEIDKVIDKQKKKTTLPLSQV